MEWGLDPNGALAFDWVINRHTLIALFYLFTVTIR